MLVNQESSIRHARLPSVSLGTYRTDHQDKVAYVFIVAMRGRTPKTVSLTDESHYKFRRETDYVFYENLAQVLQGKLDVQDMVASLVSVRRVPGRWASDIDSHLSVKGKSMSTTDVGHIVYELSCDGKHASPFAYYPRHALGKHGAKGIPYFMEALAVHNLKNSGITKISQSGITVYNRSMQLARIGLPTLQLFDTDFWLERLGKGIGEFGKSERRSSK